MSTGSMNVIVNRNCDSKCIGEFLRQGSPQIKNDLVDLVSALRTDVQYMES